MCASHVLTPRLIPTVRLQRLPRPPRAYSRPRQRPRGRASPPSRGCTPLSAASAASAASTRSAPPAPPAKRASSAPSARRAPRAVPRNAAYTGSSSGGRAAARESRPVWELAHASSTRLEQSGDSSTRVAKLSARRAAGASARRFLAGARASRAGGWLARARTGRQRPLRRARGRGRSRPGHSPRPGGTQGASGGVVPPRVARLDPGLLSEANDESTTTEFRHQTWASAGQSGHQRRAAGERRDQRRRVQARRRGVEPLPGARARAASAA